MNPTPPAAQAHDDALTIGDLADAPGSPRPRCGCGSPGTASPAPSGWTAGTAATTSATSTWSLQVLRRRDNGARLEVAIAGVVLAQASVGAPPGAPSVYARCAACTRTLHAAAADEVHAAGAVLGHRGRVLRAGREADDLRRLPGGALLPGRPGALGRAGPDLPRRRWCSPRSAPSRHPVDRTTFVDLPDDAPMRREWAVVCDAADHPAMLTAWELPGQSTVPDSSGCSRPSGPSSRPPYATPPGPAPRWPSSSGTPRAHRCSTSSPRTRRRRRWSCWQATSLLNRVVAYVDRAALSRATACR